MPKDQLEFVGAKLPAEVKAKLEAIAKEQKQSVNQIIGQLVEKGLSNPGHGIPTIELTPEEERQANVLAEAVYRGLCMLEEEKAAREAMDTEGKGDVDSDLDALYQKYEKHCKSKMLCFPVFKTAAEFKAAKPEQRAKEMQRVGVETRPEPVSKDKS